MQQSWTVRVNTGLAPALAFLIVLGLLLLGAHTDFSLADEGYLWYGAERVLAGEVPLRDFQSYDPARYYWVAGIMAVLRDHGIVALRIAIALLGALGAALANWLIFRKTQRVMLLPNLLVAAVLALWMLPRHKLFDITACIALIASLALFLEHPSRIRSFLLGIGVGLIAIIGRNHGLYGAVACVLALAYVAWAERKGDPVGLYASWCAGVVVGYLPMLLALVLVPGLFPAFLDGIRGYFQIGATNIPLPLPWPWRVPFLHLSLTETLRQLLVAVLCIGLPLFGILGLSLASARVRRKSAPFSPLLIACAALAIPYTHFFYSRADMAHLAQSIFPLLIALGAWTVTESKHKSTASAALLLILSAFLMLPRQPLYAAWTSGHWQTQPIGADRVEMPPVVAADVSQLQTLVARYAPEGRSFLAAPYIPGAYALFERRAPIWDIYPLYRADDARQNREIGELKQLNIGFALVDTQALDQDPYQRFSEHDPLIYKYLRTQLRKIEDPSAPKHWEIYVPASMDEVDKRRRNK